MRKVLTSVFVAVAVSLAAWYCIASEIENPAGANPGTIFFGLACLAWLNVWATWYEATKGYEGCKGCHDKETALRMMKGVEQGLTREKMRLRREIKWLNTELERRGEVIRASQQDYVQASREAMDIATKANAACATAVEAGKQWRERAENALALFHVWRLPAPPGSALSEYQKSLLARAEAEKTARLSGFAPMPCVVAHCPLCAGPVYSDGLALHGMGCEGRRR